MLGCWEHTNRDVVVIVDHDEVAELQMTSHRSSLRGNTLHSAAITEEGVCVVVEQLVAGLVENSGGVPLSNGKTDSVGETLTKRSSGDLNTGGVVGLGVTRSDRVDLLRRLASGFIKEMAENPYTEVLEVVHADSIAEQVK